MKENNNQNRNNQNQNNQNNQNENQSKQILLSVLAVAILVVAVVGVSFAAFTYTKTGVTENTITTGTITMEYTEGDNVISLVDAMPVSDEVGKTITDEDTKGAGTIGGTPSVGNAAAVFDFTVKATANGKININYQIGAEKVTVATEEPTLDNSNIGTKELDETGVKLYLEKDEAGGEDYSQVAEPATYSELTAGAGGNGKVPAEQKVLGSGSFTASGTHTYRLRMWIADTYDMAQLNEGEKVYKGKFVVKVNVYGGAA